MSRAADKHNFGYLCIDVEAVYLTETGNWYEVRKLKESNSDKTGFRLNFKLFLYYLVFISLLAYLFFNSHMIMALVLGGLMVSSFFYLRSGLRSTYVIPIAKMIEFETDENSISKRFYNGSDVACEESFSGLRKEDVIDFRSLIESSPKTIGSYEPLSKPNTA